MATQKLQASRALKVLPSDNALIPSINVVHQGANTSVGTNLLISITATFITDNVRAGDVVYNISDSTSATVVSVQSQTQLTMNANIFAAGGKTFIVYQQSASSGLGNQGCVLYIGGAGILSCVTSGGDDIVFQNVQGGVFFPVNVIKVNSSVTTATNIIALW